jgi:MFS family permease
LVKKQSFYYGYVIVVATFAIMFVTWGMFASFGIFLNPVLDDFHWERAIFSGAYSLAVAMHGVLALLTGRLTDKLGPRIVVTISGATFGIGLLLMSQVSGIWQIYVFYGVMVGVGLAGSFVPLVPTISRWFTEKRGLIMGVATSGMSIGIFAMPPIANWLIEGWGWRNSFMIMGCVLLAVVITAAQFLKRDPSQIRQQTYGIKEAIMEDTAAEVPGYTLKEVLRMRQFWMIAIAYLCVLLSMQASMVHVAPHAIELGVSAASAAWIVALMGGASIASRFTSGIIMDRIGSKRVLVIIFACITVGMFVLFNASELWMLYLFAIMVGLGHGGFSVTMSPVLVEFFGLRWHATILGFAFFVFSTGGAIGPVMAGRIFDVNGTYYAAWLACGLISAAAIVLAAMLREVDSGKRVSP